MENYNLNKSAVNSVHVGFTLKEDQTIVMGLWDNGQWTIRCKSACSTGKLKWKIERLSRLEARMAT